MPSIWDLPQHEPQRGPAMDEARRRAVAMLGLLGVGLPTSSELRTSVLYDSGKIDAMAGGPTRGEFQEAQREKVANVALGLLGAIQPVWHGSPHKFKRFDLSKMGTGEGAQAYGHGAYLAESPGVATEYMRTLSKNSAWGDNGKGVAYTIDPQTLGRKNTVIREYTKSNPSGATWTENWGRYLDEEFDGPIAALKHLVKTGKVNKKPVMWLDSDGMINVSTADSSLYETRLRWPDPAREAADPLGPQHFLDWDKPLSEQAPEVQRTLMNLPTAHKLSPEMTGAQLLESTYLVPGSYNDKEAASGALRKLGIPGLRYLDAGSRGTGQGTHNYVVFDDALIEILKRNGVPIEGLLD